MVKLSKLTLPAPAPPEALPMLSWLVAPNDQLWISKGGRGLNAFMILSLVSPGRSTALSPLVLNWRNASTAIGTLLHSHSRLLLSGGAVRAGQPQLPKPASKSAVLVIWSHCVVIGLPI